MNERRMKILTEFTDNDTVTVAELAEKYQVSQVTIRTDFKALQQDGLIRRVHGGAAAPSDESIAHRLGDQYETKLRIAERAAQLVGPGETIMIESGSTNALLAKRLGETRDVTIVTNSCFIAHYVRDLPHVNVVLLGGNYQPDSEVCVGPLTRQSLQSFYVDKLFIGTDGYTENVGLTCVNLMRAETVSAMAAQARNTIVLTDSRKFGRRGVAGQLALSEISLVITDDRIPEQAVLDLKKHAVELITVPRSDR